MAGYITQPTWVVIVRMFILLVTVLSLPTIGLMALSQSPTTGLIVLLTILLFALIVAVINSLYIKRTIRLYVEPILKDHKVTALEWAVCMLAINWYRVPDSVNVAAFHAVLAYRVEAIKRSKIPFTVFLVMAGILNILTFVIQDYRNPINLLLGVLAFLYGITYPTKYVPQHIKRLESLHHQVDILHEVRTAKTKIA